MTNLEAAQAQMEVDDLKRKLAQRDAELQRERAAHLRAVQTLEKARASKAANLPKSKPRKLAGDRVEVITGDWHGNKVDVRAFGAFLADLQAIQPHRLFLGGDILDCGGFLAEHHALGYVADTADSYEQDVATANRLLDAAQNAANDPETHYLEGNHEWRVERWALSQKLGHHKDVELLRRAFAAEYVLRLEERGIRYYRSGEDHGCGVPGWVKLDGLYYVHRVGRSARAVVQRAAANVVYFDTHRADYLPVRKVGTGLIAAWNPGCMCKFQPLYCQQTPTEWNHGYLVRFISRTGAFQVVSVPIQDGHSFGSVIFRNSDTQNETN
ncbi:hypothetical protein EBZ39_02805 [bacterium]|nr:hypothetical protein [bacterium]